MKVALVHDYLNEFGGAERVLEALAEIFPKAPIYTAFVRENSPAHKRFKGKKIITSWAQNVPFFASKLHSPLRFLAPFIWGSFVRQLADFDVVITSASWYVTKGVVKPGKRPDLLHGRHPDQGLALAKPSFTEVSDGKPIEICYCHTPPRYLYGYTTATDTRRNFLIKAYALLVNHFMRVYDFEAAQRVDYFIANSREVAGRIKKFYRRNSTVIYPPAFAEASAGKPVDTSAYSKNKRLVSSKKTSLNAISLDAGDYFLVVSRLVASKNVDVVVEVCAKLGLPLKVVGMGRETENLMQIAKRLTTNANGSSIEFLGHVSDDELIFLYQNCRAVIFAASQEDFGMVPVEAMAVGKPVIANAEGGVLESVIDAMPAGKGKGTGVYFDPPTAGSLTLAINNFIDLEKKGYFDAEFIRNHAQKFSKERFKTEILKFVERKVK